MKVHTDKYKNQIKTLGREIDSKITYTLNGELNTLTGEQLNSVTPSFQANILKSVMKQLDIDSNINIPVGTILNYKFGLFVDGVYEYLDFGNYIVYSSKKQEDYGSYKLICYDKMLYSMKKNEELEITYPITIRNYINAICTKLGLEFKNINDNFANYDKQISQELYFGLDYTYRDIFDELAQVTASTICIDKDDKVEIRYISSTAIDTIDEEFLKDTNINFGQKYGPINSIVLSRSAESDNVYLKDEESVEANGLTEIKIIDNQILNWNDRSNYLPDILEKLNGLEYYINDFVSTGITYYDLCDRYGVSIGNKVYSCIMLNDELLITQGIVENIYTEILESSQTDYSKADKTDRKINQTNLIVNKQNQKIQALTEETTELGNKITEMTQTVDGVTISVSSLNTQVETIEQTIPKFQAELDIYNITIPVDENKNPLENKTYLVTYKTTFEGTDVTSIINCSSTNTGITFAIVNNKINLSVSSDTAITNLNNEFVVNFTYTKDSKTYTSSKKIIVTLSLKGNTGAKGEKGETGSQGEKGDKGDKGEQGIQGEKGEKGDTGATGEQGIQGIQGEKGDKGDTGEQGLKGDTGEKGDKGDTGASGKDGTNGTNGTDGKNSYFHIKYSNDGTTFTSNDGTDVGRYIGSYTDYNETASTNFDDYSWQDTAIVVDEEIQGLQSQINTTNASLNTNIDKTSKTSAELQELSTKVNDVNDNVSDVKKDLATTNSNVETLEGKITNMTFNFSTKGLSIGNKTDLNNSLLDSYGIRVYNADKLMAIFNYKGSGIEKLIVTGSSQIGYFKTEKSTKTYSLNGTEVTKKVNKHFFLKELIEDLEDLEG